MTLSSLISRVEEGSELASASCPKEPSNVEAIADLIDNLAKCRSENAMDRAFLDNSDEIAAAVLKLIADRDGEWACTVNRLEDRIDGLNADLDSAVEVAFRRGAVEWTRLNYPTLHMRLSDTASQDKVPALENSKADLADAHKKDRP